LQTAPSEVNSVKETAVSAEHLKLLRRPGCKSGLEMIEVQRGEKGRVRSAVLTCAQCSRQYPVVDYIPRFEPADNYASNFGLQWSKHPETQYDSHSGRNVSERRFFEETKWGTDLRGQRILEVGSGSGRFTEQALSTGAMVVSMDYSSAVTVNYARHGFNDDLLIIQADVYRMPLYEGFFDKIFCFGVLQHTPDPRRAFLSLPPLLRQGGDIAVDVYRKLKGLRAALQTKYWVRPITTRMDPGRLYELTRIYVGLMWPVSRLIHKLPLGRQMNWALLIADYEGIYDLSNHMLKTWAILDTFDMLSPTYDLPQTLDSVQEWFAEAKLQQIEVQYGYNGIEGRGKKR